MQNLKLKQGQNYDYFLQQDTEEGIIPAFVGAVLIFGLMFAMLIIN